MADAVASKATVRKDVRVRLPPAAYVVAHRASGYGCEHGRRCPARVRNAHASLSSRSQWRGRGRSSWRWRPPGSTRSTCARRRGPTSPASRRCRRSPGSEGVGTIAGTSGACTSTRRSRRSARWLSGRSSQPMHRSTCPTGSTTALAVALGIAGLAGWLPLEWRARLRPGETRARAGRDRRCRADRGAGGADAGRRPDRRGRSGRGRPARGRCARGRRDGGAPGPGGRGRHGRSHRGVPRGRRRRPRRRDRPAVGRARGRGARGAGRRRAARAARPVGRRGGVVSSAPLRGKRTRRARLPELPRAGRRAPRRVPPPRRARRRRPDQRRASSGFRCATSPTRGRGSRRARTRKLVLVP